MCPFNRFLFIRLLIVCLLALAAVGMVGAAPGQVMVTYANLPIYGSDSGVNATMDLYLPEIALDETQHELGITLQNDLPAVLFVPALDGPTMREYAQDLTDRGYGVIAVDYRLPNAVADSMCALAWAHAIGTQYHLDANHIAAVGTAGGGQIAALMGSADLGWQPTYEGGLVRVDTPAPYPIHGLDRCPYAMPDAPMIEAVATYNGDLGTPVALVDTAYQMATLPPVGTTRAQMVAAFNEFAFAPPDEWRGMVAGIEPETATVTPVAADGRGSNLSLWQLTPPEIAAAHQVTSSVDVEVPLMEENPVVDLWQLTPPEVAAMFAGEPSIAELNPDWMADVAIVLPAYWLDGNEPPHLLMVGGDSNAVIHADNAVYTELLRDHSVPVKLTELSGCADYPCALFSEMEPLNMFLADVMFGS